MKFGSLFALVVSQALNIGMAADSPELKEWKEYCEMTVHIKVDGWVTEKTEEEVLVPVDESTLTCQAFVGRDQLGRKWTYVSADLRATLLSMHFSKPFHIQLPNLSGDIEPKEACATATDLITRAKASGGKLPMRLQREVVRQDWTSEKNTDVSIVESATLTLDDKIAFNGGGSVTAKGKYCSNKPAQ